MLSLAGRRGDSSFVVRVAFVSILGGGNDGFSSHGAVSHSSGGASRRSHFLDDAAPIYITTGGRTLHDCVEAVPRIRTLVGIY
jgi:hypothetical protein